MISTAELATMVGPGRLNELLELDALAAVAKERLETATAEHQSALAELKVATAQAEQGNVLERAMARQKATGLEEVVKACADALRRAEQEHQAAAFKSRTLRDSLVNAHRRLQELPSETMPEPHRDAARTKLQGVLGLQPA